MKKLKPISFVLVLCLAFSVAPIALGVTVSAEPAEFNAVTEAVPDDNVLYMSDFDSAGALNGISANSKQLSQIRTDTGSYLQLQYIVSNYVGIELIHPDGAIPAGDYLFTGYFRMMYVDELTALRVMFNDEDGKLMVIGQNSSAADVKKITVYPTSDEWIKVEVYVSLDEPMASITVCGETDARFVQPYCIDNFSLVPAAIPTDYVIQTWGTPISAADAYASQVDSKFAWPEWYEEFEAQYEVQGIVMNQDADSLIGSVPATVEGIKKFAYGYAGSHVTDFMLCVNNINSTFRTELEDWTDLVDKYYQTEENGIAVDYTTNSSALGAYQHYVVHADALGGRDYFDVLCEAFKEVNIRPWLSIRMNDLHGTGDTTSVLLSDYFHENPQYRRVLEERRSYAAKSMGSTYYFRALDYTHDAVRERFLAYVEEVVSRYDCYGIELDFLREIWLWHPGGEYNGLDLLNDFMRDVQAITEKYSLQRGADIKVCVRVPSDVETNYDFGLDVITWAAEGLIDMIIPSGRYGTTDTDIPVTLWKSLMHPYRVSVAPCIEIRIQKSGSSFYGSHTFETYNGIAASFLSQGADKIALFNQYIGFSGIDDFHKISSYDDMVSGTYRHWVINSTIGSYEKLMTLDRRLVLTYNDVYSVWKRSTNAQLPKTVAAAETATLRFPIGDIPLGAAATVKFSVTAPNDTALPTVYINSQPAAFVGIEFNEEGFTSLPILSYSVPTSALDDTYAVVEITPSSALTIDYAEAYVAVAD